MRFFKPRNFFDLLKIKRLYKRAFPKCERKPFPIILRMAKLGRSDLWYFEDEGGFAGLCATINGEREILIDYLATAEKRRGKGVGSKMLAMLLEHYKDYGVFLEIEEIYPAAQNNQERVRRKEFYLRAGLEPMQTHVNLFGVNMELLGKNCRLSFDEYRDFYLCNYGKFAYDHILPPQN